MAKHHSPDQLAKLAAKEAEWRQIMSDWKASGIDGRSYAKLNGINEHRFYAWKRTIRLRDEAKVDARQAAGSKSNGAGPRKRKAAGQSKGKLRADRKPARGTGKGADKSKGKSPLFIPVQVKAASNCIELRHPSGCTLLIPENYDHQSLTCVLESLETLERNPC